MPASKAQQKAVHKYTKNNYDSILVTLKPKGIKDTIKSHAAARGESVNGFIGRAITETMDRDNGGNAPESPSERDSGGGGSHVTSDTESPSEGAENGKEGGITL